MADTRLTSKRATIATGKSRTTALSLNAAGAADEDMFLKTFEVVPRIVIYSVKDLTHELTDIINVLNDASKDWEKRVDSLKRVRSLIIAGGIDFEDFFHNLKQLELAFQVALKDLRSKVVREACITIAFMSQVLGMKVDRFVEGLLPLLINLIPNSAKIMSTSGYVCIRFIIEFTHAPRLIPIICTNMSSKAREIRKACCEFLDQLLHTWQTHSLEKHVSLLQEAIKKGINDADSEARVFSRKAFWGFADHFKDQADSMIHSFDAQKQKALYGEVAGGLSASSSSNSINSQPISSSWSTHHPHHQANGRSHHQSSSRYALPPAASRPNNNNKQSVSTSNSVENLYRPWSAMSGTRIPTANRSKIPVISPKESEASIPSPFRCGSAIDVGAARRARARAVIASAMMSQPHPSSSVMSRSMIQRSRYESLTSAASSVASPDRQSRINGRVSQSQPGSRSTSPSSYLNPYRVSSSSRKSSIPTATSRDTSPARHHVDRSHVTDRSAQRSRKISDTVDSPSNHTPRLNSNQFDKFRRSSEGCDGVLKMESNGNGVYNTKHSPPSRLLTGSDDHNEISSCLSADHCMDLLKPVIGELPFNQAAIKMLTKLVEQQPKSVVSGLLPEMMPALVQAYDSPEIAVRKAAVFAMVAIHSVAGEEEMKPFLLHLNGSKMKLLNLYIERSKSQATNSNSSSNGCSTPTSSH